MTTIQLSFGDGEATGKRKRTRREVFLAETTPLMPWRALLASIAPHDPSMDLPRRQPNRLNRLATMLRIYFLRHSYASSAPAMEATQYGIPVMRRFARLGGLDDIADETTTPNFRRLLETHDLARKSFERMYTHPARKGRSLRAGAVVDATIIAAASSSKNADGERDPKIDRTKKDNPWHFGMKAQIEVDDESGLVQGVDTTANECTYRLGWRN